MVYHANHGPIARPLVPVKANEQLSIGAAMHLAKSLVTATHYYILIQGRHHPVSIQGDTRRGREVYYIRYRNRAGEVEFPPPVNTTAEVVRWLSDHDLSVGLGEWDVTVFPRADQIPTMMEV
jgi:hypothetical protein